MKNLSLEKINYKMMEEEKSKKTNFVHKKVTI